MTIYALIPVHNRIDLTLQFLDSLDAQTTQEPVEVFIVDDGSSDGTAEALAERRGRFPVTRIPGNGRLWWAGGVKTALNVLRPQIRDCDWVYLGNNDTILAPDHVQRLLEAARGNDDSLVGSVALEIWPDGTEHPVSSGFYVDEENLQVRISDEESLDRIDALAGRGLLIPGQAFRQAKFHPLWMPQHFADLFMTSQLRKLGFKLLVERTALSTQTDRASSALEWGHVQRLSLRKSSPLYLPALIAFWWSQLGPRRFMIAAPLALRRLQNRTFQ